MQEDNDTRQHCYHNNIILTHTEHLSWEVKMLFLPCETLSRYQIGEDAHRRHVHLQKCRHSKREQNHQKIKEGVDQVGMDVEAKVALEVEEECKEVYTVVKSALLSYVWLSFDCRLGRRWAWWAWWSQREWRWLAGSLGILGRKLQTATKALSILSTHIHGNT